MPYFPISEVSSVSVWEEVWHEATPGTESGIRNHVAEICILLKTALELPSWTMKAQVNIQCFLQLSEIWSRCCRVLFKMFIPVFYNETADYKSNSMAQSTP